MDLWGSSPKPFSFKKRKIWLRCFEYRGMECSKGCRILGKYCLHTLMSEWEGGELDRVGSGSR